MNTLSAVAFICCCSLIFLVGVFGNALVVKWFNTGSAKHTVGSRLVVILAINDLISSIVVPFAQVHAILQSSMDPYGAWYLGKFLCHILPGIQSMFLIATSWILVAISLERFR